MRPIGLIESCFREKFGTPRQASLVPDAPARLRVAKEFVPEQSLRGLDGFSHVWLLWSFHLNTNKALKPIVHPPRLLGKTVGVFASRSPHRPNPIGLSLARLVRVEGDTLHLAGVDLVDGTPILDVKPYIPACDKAEKARAGWTEELAPQELAVVFGAKAKADLRRLKDLPGLKTLIAQVLRHDQRNPRDKSQLREGKPLYFILHDCAVSFCVRRGKVTVLGVRRARKKAWALAFLSRSKVPTSSGSAPARPQAPAPGRR